MVATKKNKEKQMDNSNFLIPDASHFSGDPDWSALAKDSRFFGAIIKATEGISYGHDSWFKKHWRPLREAGANRERWLRGVYHYLIFTDADAPEMQADYFATTVEEADTTKGFGKGEIMPIIDVELGADSSPNHRATKQRVIDYTSRFAGHLKARWRCRVMLYGHSAMLDLHIEDKMGCDRLWLPSYTKQPADPAAIGWAPEEVLLWQYTDGNHNKTDYPSTAPGIKSADISVLYHRDGVDWGEFNA